MPLSRTVGVIVWNNRAFIPSLALTDTGLLLQIDPVHDVELAEDALAVALSNAWHSPLPRIKGPSQDEWKTLRDPVLAATGAKNWRELVKKGLGGGITEIPGGIRVSFSRRTKEGDWQEDRNRALVFPEGTPFSELAKALLDGFQLPEESP